jgi:hypothetical protein
MLCASCTPLTPPPLFARHAGAAPDAKGTVTVVLAVGIGVAGMSGGMGLELRARWQTADDLALGLGAGYAWGDGDPDETVTTTRLVALRLFGQASPFGTDAAAVTFGAGLGGVNTGLRYATLDAGAVASGTIADTVEPSLGIALAAAFPIVQGAPFGSRGSPRLPTTTFYVGASLGLALHFGGTKNVLSGEVGAYLARSTGGDEAFPVYLSGADAQGIGP